MNSEEERHPFAGVRKAAPPKKRAEKVRFDKLYERIKDLAATDSSSETETISLKEMAEYLGIRAETLRVWIRKGIISPRRNQSGKIYFRKDDFIPEFFQPDGTYTPVEVAKIINRTVSCVYSLLRRGELSARKYGNRWVITRNDLQDYFDSGIGTI